MAHRTIEMIASLWIPLQLKKTAIELVKNGYEINEDGWVIVSEDTKSCAEVPKPRTYSPKIDRSKTAFNKTYGTNY